MAINILIVILFIILVCLIVCNIVLNANSDGYSDGYSGDYNGGMQPAEMLTIGDAPPILVGMPKTNNKTTTILSIYDIIDDYNIIGGAGKDGIIPYLGEDRAIISDITINIEDSIILIRSVFTELGIDNIYIDRNFSQNSINVGVNINAKNWLGFECLFTDRNIYITWISGCNIEFSGNRGLQVIYDIAVKLSFNSISLNDSSNLKFTLWIAGRRYELSIQLPIFYILAYGQSWYNKNGYYGLEYQTEQRINLATIELSIDEFINEMIKYYNIREIIINRFIVFNNEMLHTLLLKNGSYVSQIDEGIDLLHLLNILFNNLINVINIFNDNLELNKSIKIKLFFQQIILILKTNKDNNRDNHIFIILKYLELLLEIIYFVILNSNNNFLFYLGLNGELLKKNVE